MAGHYLVRLAVNGSYSEVDGVVAEFFVDGVSDLHEFAWRWSSGSEKRSSCMPSSSVRKERALYATAATTATSDTLSVLCARNNF